MVIFTDYFHEVLPSTSQNQPVIPQPPAASSEPIFLCCEDRTSVCVCECMYVCVCFHPPPHPTPPCHSRSFPTERVPALCVCWLTGPKERRLFSTYPETLPCQVWDEILSIALTPHSRAPRSKTHTITAPGGGVTPREKSVRYTEVCFTP